MLSSRSVRFFSVGPTKCESSKAYTGETVCEVQFPLLAFMSIFALLLQLLMRLFINLCLYCSQVESARLTQTLISPLDLIY